MTETTTEIRSLDDLRLDAVRVTPSGPSTGIALLVHGITADRDEGGMYRRLAESLADGGLESVRFSFRGHGSSGGTQRGVTIAGEIMDVVAALKYCSATNEPVSIVASSFGAVSVLSLLRRFRPAVSRLVLWNPVLDLRNTFLEPDLPWGIANFGRQRLDSLPYDGGLRVDGGFELSATFFDEMSLYDPASCFASVDLPSLVIHGSRDEYVSFEIAKKVCSANQACTFLEVPNADHGFDQPDEERIAIEATVRFLA